MTRFLRVATMLSVAATAAARAQTGKPDTTLVVSTQWLAAHLNDRDVVVLHVERTDSGYARGHIPGSRRLAYASYTALVNGVRTELPPADSLARLFESVGISNDSRVVLTGGTLDATRAFFTLEYLGLRRIAMLDGGLKAWRAEGRPVVTDVPQMVRGRIVPHPRPEVVASADYVRDRMGKEGYSVIDTRTSGEYLGTTTTGVQRSAGHIDGARQLEWESMFRDPTEFTPKPLQDLAVLWRQRVAPGDTVITYCTVGWRASGSYFMSRYLGYPVKLYDGSYDEWTQRQLPVVTTDTPLRRP